MGQNKPDEYINLTWTAYQKKKLHNPSYWSYEYYMYKVPYISQVTEDYNRWVSEASKMGLTIFALGVFQRTKKHEKMEKMTFIFHVHYNIA